jgi:ribosomal protein S18 acetylase RimI-like enzyme
MHIHFQHLDNHFILRLLNKDDSDVLLLYFNNLSEQTKKRYAPHPFDKVSVEQICQNLSFDNIIRYVVEDANHQIIAYFLFKKEIFDYEFVRIAEKRNNLPRNSSFDFAPSIADAHQGAGLGKEIFRLCINELKILGCTHLVLWGGVQKSNEKAVKYYQKLGFQIVNEFEYQGLNYDMIMNLD